MILRVQRAQLRCLQRVLHREFGDLRSIGLPLKCTPRRSAPFAISQSRSQSLIRFYLLLRAPIWTAYRHRLDNVLACLKAAALGRRTGETTMAKLLNIHARGDKPAQVTISPSFAPSPLAIAERDRREALRDQQSLTAAFFGDPLPGMSALDRRLRERPH
jgi:hypothetical protein